MKHIDMWTRTAIARQDTVDKRFVNYLGGYGGFNGVSTKPTQEGAPVPVLTVGEAEVEIAPSQSIAVGDLVVGNAQGLATKSTSGQGAYVLEVRNNTVYVIVK